MTQERLSPKAPSPISILFVCMGNICRSPSAEGVFLSRLKLKTPEWLASGALKVDSAGTHGYHVGAPPDPRSIEAALNRGVDLRALRARQVTPEDFEEYHYILAMDHRNMADLEDIAGTQVFHQKRSQGGVQLFLDYATEQKVREVPDPYYGGPRGFEMVLDLITQASDGFISYLIKTEKDR